MKSLQILTLGTLLTAVFAGASADETGIEVITVTAKRAVVSLTVEKVAPAPSLEMSSLNLTDMPELEVPAHRALIGASPTSG